MKPSAVQWLLYPILGAGGGFDEGFGWVEERSRFSTPENALGKQGASPSPKLK